MKDEAAGTNEPCAAKPFAGDLLRREMLAAKLTPFVERLDRGGTIGINGDWGEGKSWFGREWAAKLSGEGHKVAYIDAFAHDFVDDPFLLIAAELAGLLEGANGSGPLAKRAGAVMRSIAPLAAKAAVNLTGRLFIGVGDLQGELKDAVKAASEEGANAANKWIEGAVASFEAEKKSVVAFKSALTEAVARHGKRVVVFVDELDRCRPSFAVSMLERLKHFFDVPNLVIVLLLNREQLQLAIQGVYGEGFDGQAYLGKFVSVWFDLPIARASKVTASDPALGPFAQETLRSLSGREVPQLSGDMQAWASALKLSLRDIERCCFLILAALGPDDRCTSLLPYLAALKIKRPDAFQRVRTTDAEAHLEAARRLEDWSTKSGHDPHDWPGRLFMGLATMHRSIAGTKPEGERAAFWSEDKSSLIGHFTPERAIAFYSDRIDLPLGA